MHLLKTNLLFVRRLHRNKALLLKLMQQHNAEERRCKVFGSEQSL